MNQIYARAFLEANREELMAQSLIRKPDSVLEYTCFDKFLGVAGEFAPSFSETEHWKDHDIDLETEDDSDTTTIDVYRPAGTLSNLLELFLLPPLQTYIESNFSHTFLGGDSTIDNDMVFSSLAGAYNCSHMYQVWNIAKCVDFGEQDQFWSFENLMQIDPRVLPNDPNPPYQSCSSGFEPSSAVPSTGGGFGVEITTACLTTPPSSYPNHDIKNDLIRVSNNCDLAYAVMDTIETNYELYRAPGNYTNSAVPTVVCGDPIPTNVKVTTYTYTKAVAGSGIEEVTRTNATHDEKFCINPGCYYDYSTDNCIQ